MWKKLKPWEAPTFTLKDMDGRKGTLRYSCDFGAPGEHGVEQLWFCEEATGKWFLLEEHHLEHVVYHRPVPQP